MRRYLIRLCLLVSIVLCCPTVFSQIRVACVGNSITEGYGLNKEKESYPIILQQKLGSSFEVRNYGLSGRTILKRGNAPYWKEKAYENILVWEPDIVIIKLGTNDSKPQNWKYKSEFYKNYIEFIKSFKDLPSNPTIYICLPVPVFKDNFDISGTVVKTEIMPLIKKAAQYMKCEIVNLYTAFYGHDDLMSSEGVHPNVKGAAFIAEEIFKALTK